MYNQTSALILASFILVIPLVGMIKKVEIFDQFLEGGKQAFPIITKIIPAIVGMYVAIGMLRASGFFTLFAKAISPIIEYFSIPAEIIPLALMRPLSGSGSIALLAETINEFGPESIEALTSATILGSTETTFYVVAVYFGALGIRQYRYAVSVGLFADLIGVAASIIICKYLFL
ncbi:spore maturation protein [Gammaproteobacteria bacterium]|nr:spore maturation protein [Gammaproteobacteria bacterium]